MLWMWDKDRLNEKSHNARLQGSAGLNLEDLLYQLEPQSWNVLILVRMCCMMCSINASLSHVCDATMSPYSITAPEYMQISYSPASTLHQTHFTSLLLLFALSWLATLSARHQTISLPLEGQLLLLHTHSTHTGRHEVHTWEKGQLDAVEWLNLYHIGFIVRRILWSVRHEIRIFRCLGKSETLLMFRLDALVFFRANVKCLC